MKQVFYTKRGDIEVCDVPAPACGDSELLVAVHYSAISAGTELKSVAPSPAAKAAKRRSILQRSVEVLRDEGISSLVKRAQDQSNLQGEPGYSAAGIVVEVGSKVSGFSAGDRVACAGGGFAVHAELIRVPPMLAVRVPDDVPLDQACWATVAAIALQGIRQAKPQFGEVVVVAGLGLLGLIAVQLARACGCHVIALDPDPRRVDRALALGASAGLDPRDESAARAAVDRLTTGIGADVVLVCATADAADPMRQALEWVRQRGRVVLVGDVPIHIPRSPFYQKEAEVTIACSYGPGRYDERYELDGIDYPVGFVRWTENRNLGAVVEAIRAKRLDVEALTTHRFSVVEAVSAYAVLAERVEDALGVLLHYPAAHGQTPPPQRSVTQPGASLGVRVSASERIGVAVIGAGSFATAIHLPLLEQHPDAALRVVTSRTGMSSTRAARRFGADRASTDWRESIDSPDVHAVVIATRHDTHADIAAYALQRGKHVLVEKPLGLTQDEIDQLVAAQSSHDAVLLVGHNRRFAPAALALRAALAESGGPATVWYRINAGAIPASHWTQDRAVGGGRIIGEGSHFLDLLGYLVGDAIPWEGVQAVGVPVDGRRVTALDTYTATLRFADGSHAVLHYTSLGDKSLPKERVEVACAGWSAVLDDFERLTGYGAASPAWSARKQDKGFSNQMNAFIRAVRGDRSAIPSMATQERAARAVITIDDALRAHGREQ